MRIMNITQHPATPEQVASGVVDLNGREKKTLAECLIFEEIPDGEELKIRAEALADIALQGSGAMIGGAPYLMAPLERALKDRGITPLYAFSKRESVEETLPDGSVRKVAVFRHLGFVEVA